MINFSAWWALLLVSLTDLVFSVPQPVPKSANFRNWRIKNGLNGQTKRAIGNGTCAAPKGQEISAPSSNVWRSLSDDEAASIAKWLFSQPSFNLTPTAEAGEWDNSL